WTRNLGQKERGGGSSVMANVPAFACGCDLWSWGRPNRGLVLTRAYHTAAYTKDWPRNRFRIFKWHQNGAPDLNSNQHDVHHLILKSGASTDSASRASVSGDQQSYDFTRAAEQAEQASRLANPKNMHLDSRADARRLATASHCYCYRIT